MKVQRIWRVAGAVLIAAAGVMAFLGASIDWTGWPPWAFAVYWGVFLLCFVGTLYCVVVDLRHIAAEYAVMRREAFRETLGDETFRRALRGAQSKPEDSPDES